jgi:hypothetical protein
MSRPRVFISYPKADTEWVSSFSDELQKLGISVRLDPLLTGTEEPNLENLEASLRESDVVVAVVDSNTAIGSGNVWFEIGAAMSLDKPIMWIRPRELDVSRMPATPSLRRQILRNSPDHTAGDLVQALAA